MSNAEYSCFHASRLLRRLTEMDVIGAPVVTDYFAERVGSLLDLSGSVMLSNMLGELPHATVESTGITPEAIKDAFLMAHAGLVRDIVKRFVPRGGPSRYRLPSPSEFFANCMLKDVFSTLPGAGIPNSAAAYAPYRNHYLTIQGHLSVVTQRLHMKMGQAVAGLSPKLAGLAALDRGLGDAFYHRQHHLLGRIPELLEHHFEHLLVTNWQTLSDRPSVSDLAPWMASGGWISMFGDQMQELLLSELELRLLPVLGMIEMACESGEKK